MTASCPPPTLPHAALLHRAVPTPGPEAPEGRVLGASREGRPIYGYRFGRGPFSVSLIAGCHADEPTGPELLERLVEHLADIPENDPLLTQATWSVVPHANPDGRARNAVWAEATVREGAERIYDLAPYLENVVREYPGDDVEFGFPEGLEDTDARPENRAVAAFLAEAAPFHLHATLHGMAFAHGPWFLIEEAWVDRTGELRERITHRVREMGYALHDVDRKGEKGFSRIEEGFSTRPDSRAMKAHFRGLGDEETAALFRPSSMEYVRSLGGDPLTLVTEMPLFVVTESPNRPPLPKGHEGKEEFAAWVHGLAAEGAPDDVRREAARHGVRGMPLRDQMALQIAFLNEGLRAVTETPANPP